MRQQHRRLSPAAHQHRCRDLLSRAPRLPVPPSCFLHSASSPAFPVHPLHSHRCLQRTVVWSRSRAVGPTAESHPRTPARQHLPALGPLPSHTRWTGPDSRAGFPSDQHSAEVCQQPRRPQPEDHIGLEVRAGPDPGPAGRERFRQFGHTGTGRLLKAGQEEDWRKKKVVWPPVQFVDARAV